MSAEMCDSGTRAEQVAWKSVGRIRLSRAPRMMYKSLLDNGAQSTDRALEYYRRVAIETDSALVRAAAKDRECICEAIRISYAPHAPCGRGLPPAVIRREGLATASGIMRTLPRMVKDAVRAGAPFLRVFGVRFAYPVKCNLPLSKAVVAPVAPGAFPTPATVRPQRASKPDDVGCAQFRTSSPPKYESRWRPRGAPESSRGCYSATSRQYGELDEPRRRFRGRFCAMSSGHADRVVGKKTREERLRAWDAGVDAKGRSQDLRENCYTGTGSHVPQHKGRSRQDLGNPCLPQSRAPGCEGKDICHWARDCPSRTQLDKEKMKRRF